MTWREEPLTRGDLYDALSNASKRVRKGEKGIDRMADGSLRGSYMRYIYKAFAASLHALASFGEEVAADVKGPQRYEYHELFKPEYSFSDGLLIRNLGRDEELAVATAQIHPASIVYAVELPMED